ncbi:MAG TPA: hypothetical protein VHC69_16950 [Polyangiaceae bacterium]|nr:hypothetical protein [Polyangiaceae bacterium]
MDLAKKAETQRKLIQQLHPVIHRGDVVRDLLDVLERDTGRGVVLVKQQVCQRGLRALNLARKHGFFPDVAVEELVWSGKKAPDAVEASECESSNFEPALKWRVDDERWLGRQRFRDEGGKCSAPRSLRYPGSCPR